MKKNRLGFSTAQIIAFSFLITILVGSVLLTLPISAANGQATNYADALFTSTSATCVTGLVTVPTFSHWSLFGQIIILILIQCGGLGIVTLTSLAMIFIGKKLSIKDRLLLQDAFSLDSMNGQIKFVKKVVKGTFFVEGIGAILYTISFIPKFGFFKGLGTSVCTSISAFCNAGLDIMYEDSLVTFAKDPLVNFVTMALIVLGGIGFVVWWDIARVFKQIQKKQIRKKHCFLKLTLHSKIVILTTLMLIIGGALLIFMFEYNNPKTMGSMNIGQKMMASLFQSVTTRTAGFMTVMQDGLTDSSALICIVLMFIGGSPVGTAGGIKTATFAAIVIAALTVINNRQDPSVFKRRLAHETIQKALAVMLVSLTMLFISTLLLATFSEGSILDILYETTSAIATVGLSRNLTPTLNLAGKIIITVTMYLGRIGPITMAIVFGMRIDKNKSLQFPQENIKVG